MKRGNQKGKVAKSKINMSKKEHPPENIEEREGETWHHVL